MSAAAHAQSVFDTGVLRADEPRFAANAASRPVFGVAAVGEAATPGADGESIAGSQRNISARKAAGLSLLLPGLGEQRLGHTLRAKIFYGLEGLTWLSFGSFLYAGYSREKSYQDYAIAFAEVKGTGYSSDFYEAIGKYLSSDGPGGYHETIRRDARDYYYPDVAAMEAYYRAHAFSSGETWNWRSLEAFRNYAALRSGSRTAYRVALYSVIFAAALRVASAADAARLARIENRPSAEENTLSIGIERAPQGVALYLQRSF